MKGFLHAMLALCLATGATTAVNAEIVLQDVPYTDGETQFVGHIAYDNATDPRRPGVLIIHQWTGPSDYEKRRARMLAEMGYVAFVADIYGSDEEGNLIRPESGPGAGAIAGSFRQQDRTLFRERANLALEQLRNAEQTDPERLAAIGYCFGGTGVLELARSGADVQAVVSFHGGLDSPNPDDGANIKAAVLVLHASNDPTTPWDDIRAMMEEFDTHGVDWQMNVYTFQGHSFTDENASSYSATADRRSWQAMQSFFREHLGAPRAGMRATGEWQRPAARPGRQRSE